MNETLRYRYVMFPHINDKLKKSPIGSIARRYTLPVILTVFRPLRSVVVRARICVMRVAKTRCHVVRMTGKANSMSSRIFLLKKIRPELSPIHVLHHSSQPDIQHIVEANMGIFISFFTYIT